MKLSKFIFSSLMFIISCSTDDEPKPLEAAPLQEPVESAYPPANSVPTSMGIFIGFAHGLSGQAVVYTDDKKMRKLRLEDFNMTSGPDVYVFLSKTNNYSAGNTIPITMLKGSFSNSNLTLALNGSIDLSIYKFVLVYCVQYSSLFGYTEPL
jgi:hypothetical protein